MAMLPSRFRVLSHLSETLYGGIYLCEDSRSKVASSQVVLKQIELLQAMKLLNADDVNARAVDDPRQEKAIANVLRRTGGHMNVVQYKDDFIQDRMLYFVMEYCADGDLFDYLSRQERNAVEPMEALAVLAQVSAGLAFLHRENIAHRDLSLENIMVHRGVCKIGDFGLSTRADRTCTERVGKAYYMAPEVVAGMEYDAKAADIWSLGMVLFILLTGSPLFPIASVGEKAFIGFTRAGVRAVFESWGVASTLSIELIDLLTSLLHIDPSKRISIDQVVVHRAFTSWTPYVSTQGADDGLSVAVDSEMV
ncbi:hypothetical protein Poli38472_011757 [Pythium oligandrum]|uniref:Protein kinase domain-containing protein n=1 Tax=Pythium oligandrum TaxID=41045 RepID=A0A8K1FEP7_PYTOL|nr:hypothetical protein Poli38472_011757 [Pythium oligandrum]|eukprot:TMW58169.1 hypothetical protein Poli38472_011757 [Pythium oligandrum]